MRRPSLRAAAAASIVASTAMLALPGMAGAQTPNTGAFCAARVQIGPSSSPEQLKTGLGAMAQNASGAAVAPATALEALYAKKGEKTFNTEKAFGYISEIDRYVYDSCPGTPVGITGIDYQFQGIPASLPAGTAKIQFTNGAPKEQHEIAIVRLLPGNEGMDPTKLFEMSDKKAAKYADLERATFAFARPGETTYTVTELEPGTYVYGCFIPVGGKKHGAPHYTEGMYGTFTVS
jgi:hypothetical protein